MLADQMISRLQFLHERNFVHRDLKPANFAMGNAESNNDSTVFLLDFGMAKNGEIE